MLFLKSYELPESELVILHKNMALHVYEDIMTMTKNLNKKYIIGAECRARSTNVSSRTASP